jgi:hypothetical protein
MSAVLRWVRSNLSIVVFVAVMIVAPAGIVIVSAGMNASVREEVSKRAAKLADLKKIEQTQVRLEYPVRGNQPLSEKILVNPEFLKQYGDVVDRIAADVKEISAAALDFNRKSRGVLLEELFPEPPVHLRETLPQKFHEALVAAYEGLLKRVGAGSPPPAAEVREELEYAGERYRTQILMKERAADLAPDEQASLTEDLTTRRLSLCADAARQCRVFATLASLDVPPPAWIPHRADEEGLTTLFGWQWDYWVKSDVVEALGAANAAAQSVLDAPVKRILSVVVRDQPQASAGSPPAGSTGQQVGGFGVSGSGIGKRAKGGTSAKQPAPGGGARERDSAPPDAAGTPRINDRVPAPIDYSISFTGRRSNALYDVTLVDLDLIADTRRVPEVLDALCRQNFFTILDLALDEVDVFDEAREGYFYGPGQISRITLVLESVWLREWTGDFMPAHLRPVAAEASRSRRPGRGASDDEADEDVGDDEE